MKGDYIIAILPEVLSMQFLKGKIPTILNTIKPEKRAYYQGVEFLFWELNSIDHDQFFDVDWAELCYFLNELEHESPRFELDESNSKQVITYSPKGSLIGFGAVGVSEDSFSVDEWGDPGSYQMYPEIRLICDALEVSSE